ncbi:hypothetical protein CsatB_027829 [Cannabis sativa]
MKPSRIIKKNKSVNKLRLGHRKRKSRKAAIENTSNNQNVITLKLLIDTKKKRVLFAEGGKDFTDFLFSLLSIPVGTIIRLLSTNIGMVGTLGKLYQSLENLSDTYIQSNVDKDILLKPKSSALGQSSNLLSLTNDDHDITSHELYSCGKKANNYSSGLGSHCSTKKYSCPNKYVADDPKATCPDCGSLLNKVLTFVPPPNSTEVGSSSSSSSRSNDDVGIVKGLVTYMIMDDLEVKPMSSISSIALLNTFNVKEIGALQEKIVSVGINEGLRLLKASLLTKTVLTHVFLGN